MFVGGLKLCTEAAQTIGTAVLTLPLQKKFTILRESKVQLSNSTAGCNTPFHSKRPTYYYEVKDGQAEADGASTSFAGPSEMHAHALPDGTVSQPIEENGRRRTERVKREKPHFYDASEFENKNKKVNILSYS